MTSAAVALGQMKMPAGQPTAPPIPANAPVADFTLDIAPYLLEASPKHRFPTVAYNGQVPGPLLRMKAGHGSVDRHPQPLRGRGHRPLARALPAGARRWRDGRRLADDSARRVHAHHVRT